MAYKKIKNQHCCQKLRSWMESERFPLVYNPKYRSYTLTTPQYYRRDREPYPHSYQCDFCPYCGTKFPSDLGDLRYNILKNECGFEGGSDEEKLIPKEFMTEEWWRKRGL